MDLRQLRSFLAVIDHGSFSAAAAALFTVQSNVSSHVARLEAELDTTLLDRRTRELTPAGHIVEQRGREVLRQLDAVGDDLAAIENRIIGDVACGTTPSIGLRVIPPTLARATTELPEVSVTVVEAHSGQLVQQLLSGELDVALTTGAKNTDLVSTPLFTEDIVAVISSKRRVTARDQVQLADLANHKLLLPLQDNPLHGHITRAFSAADVTVHDSLEVGSSALVQAMSEADVGIALVPATAAADADGRDVTVHRIADMAPRAVALARRNVGQPNQAVTAIHTIMREIAQAAAISMPGCHTTPREASD